jgi:hypothetical protein
MFVVAYYERWSGRLAANLLRNASVVSTPIIADKPSDHPQRTGPYLFGREQYRRHPQLGWNRAVQATPIIADKPSGGRDFIPRPYLFKEYPRQARLGWNTAHDQDARTKHPDTHWTPVKQWARWLPQPSLGWTAPSDTGIPDVPPPWTPVTPWSRWLPQPQYGWSPAGDAPEPPTPIDESFGISVVAYYERWSARFAFLGWNPPTDATVPPLPDTPSPPRVSTRPWPRGFTLQPFYGWNPAQDAGPVQEGEAESLLLTWEREWTLQPWLGWATGGAADPGAEPLIDTPVPHVLHAFLFLPYRPQPSLGWMAATDVPPVSPPPTARRNRMPMFIRRLELHTHRNW